MIKNIKYGDAIDSPYALLSVSLNSYSKGFKLDVELGDSSGSVNGVLWDCEPKIANKLKPGEIVHVNGIASAYQNKIQVNLNSIEPFQGDIDIENFIPKSVHGIDKMWEKLTSKIESIGNEQIKKLLYSFFDDAEFSESFRRIPAGKKWHHAFIGGLLQHTLYMLQIADDLTKVYPKCNRDLLLCGVLLHDIGKIYELGVTGNIDYTTKGRLEGHISIGYHVVMSAIEKIDGFPENLASEIGHLILSHQGEREHGSPVVPCTLEAVILHLVDQIDSQVNAYQKIIEKEAEEGAEWSAYIKLRDRFFYFGDKYINTKSPSQEDLLSD